MLLSGVLPAGARMMLRANGYSHAEIQALSPKEVLKEFGAYVEGSDSFWVYLGSKIIRVNVFPIFFLLVVVVAGTVFWSTIGDYVIEPVLAWGARAWKRTCPRGARVRAYRKGGAGSNGGWGKGARKNKMAFTGIFAQPVTDPLRFLNNAERAEGWRIMARSDLANELIAAEAAKAKAKSADGGADPEPVEDDGRRIKVKRTLQGKTRYKKVWECLKDVGSFSYRLETDPKFAGILEAQEQANAAIAAAKARVDLDGDGIVTEDELDASKRKKKAKKKKKKAAPPPPGAAAAEATAGSNSSSSSDDGVDEVLVAT